jgi:uncharacterized protein (DUF1778 family)
MAEPKRKEKRIYLRLSSLAKMKIERAAALSGSSLTEFVLSTAVQKADQVIGEHEHLVLTGRDRDAFLEALARPSKPNKALRETMSHYRSITRKPARRKK